MTEVKHLTKNNFTYFFKRNAERERFVKVEDRLNGSVLGLYRFFLFEALPIFTPFTICTLLLHLSQTTKFKAALSLTSDFLNFLSNWNLPQTLQIPVPTLFKARITTPAAIEFQIQAATHSPHFPVS